MEKNIYICTMKSFGTDLFDEGALLLSVSGNLVNFKKDEDRQSLSSLVISMRLTAAGNTQVWGTVYTSIRFYQNLQRDKQMAPHFLYN